MSAVCVVCHQGQAAAIHDGRLSVADTGESQHPFIPGPPATQPKERHMSTIPEGYRLAVLNPDGTIVETVDLGGYDLSKSVAALDVAADVAAAIDRAERLADDDHDEKRRSRSS